MSGAEPEEHVRVPLLLQQWRDVAFIHWRYEPADVQKLLPPGLVVDTFDDSAWVGLTPFKVEGFRAPMMPSVPRLSDFPETNLRTYVRGPDGRDGLWFFTLEADSATTTAFARTAIGVPYRWAEMTVEQADGEVHYVSRRRGATSVGHRISVRPGRELERRPPGDLADWLTGRWRAWSRVAGRLVTVPVEHEPWPLFEATAPRLEETLRSDAGLSEVADRPHVLFSPGVSPKFGWSAPAGGGGTPD